MCFRKRVIAFIIDVILLTIMFMLINIIPFYDDYIMASNDFNRVYYIVYAIGLCLVFAGFISKDSIKGQSLGKRIMKIKVADTYGKTPNIFKLFLRNITMFIWPIEAVLVLLNKKKLGDRIAGTNVVEVDC